MCKVQLLSSSSLCNGCTVVSFALFWRHPIPRWRRIFKLQYHQPTSNLLTKYTFFFRVTHKLPNLLQNNNVSQLYFLPIGYISLGNFNLKKLTDQIAAGLPSFLGSLTAVSVPWSIWEFTESLEFSLSTWIGLWRVWTTSWTIAPPAWASNWWPLSSKKAFLSPASSMCLPSITVQFSYNTVLGINCSK